MKFRIKYYIAILFLGLSMAFPNVIEDAYVRYLKYKDYYFWMTFEKYATIEMASWYFDVSVDKICALIQSESWGDPNAISIAGARGLCQILPLHHNGPAHELHNIQLNIFYGARYLKWCLDFAKGDFNRALMAYNAGPGLPPWRYPANLQRDYIDVIKKNYYITKQLSDKEYKEVK